MDRDGQKRRKRKRGGDHGVRRETNIPHEQASIHERNDPFIYF